MDDMNTAWREVQELYKRHGDIERLLDDNVEGVTYGMVLDAWFSYVSAIDEFCKKHSAEIHYGYVVVKGCIVLSLEE